MSQLLVGYFVNSLWQVPVLVVCAWLAQRAGRLTPRARYGLWIATLLGALVLPSRGVSLRSGDLTGVTSVSAYDGPLPVMPRERDHLPRVNITLSRQVANGLAAVYLLLCAAGVARLVRAQLTVRRLVAASLPWDGVPGATERIRVLASPEGTPLATGLLRPVILLPEMLQAAPAEMLRAVMAHESAHIRRRDPLKNAALQIISLPIAYHPAAGMIHREVRRARELLVDALAARSLGSASAYATSLLTLAGQLVSTEYPLTSGLFDQTSHNILEERVMHLIAPPTSSRPLLRVARVAMTATVLTAAAAAISLIQVSPAVLAAQSSTTPKGGVDGVTGAQESSSVPAPGSVAAAPAPSVQAGRKQADERGSRARRRSDFHGNDFNLPEVQKQIDEASGKPLDAATQERLRQLSAEISRSVVDNPEFKRAMEDLHREVDSPEFKQHLRELTERAKRNALSAEEQRKMMENLDRQFRSPEFLRQMAKIKTETAELQKEIAAAGLGEGLMPGSRMERPSTSQEGAMRVSGSVMAGQRESGKSPVYPPDAKAAKISGAVVLHAIIATDGTIKSLQVLSGPPELQQSALEAVRTWVYKPYLLNGEPTEVETTITVTYSFG